MGRSGRGLAVVAAVAAVVLSAGGIAQLVAGDRSPAGGPAGDAAAGAGSSPATQGATAPDGPDASDGPTSTAPAGPGVVATSGSTADPVVPSTDPDVPGPAGPVASSDAPAPVALAVPAIDVDLSSLVRLGVADDGTIEVPADPDDAGWLTASAAPGRTGPAVIAGHVDTRDGPAVFARLDELVAGDEVVVGLEDGTSVTYVVTGSETYPKTEFPTDRVYGPAPAPVLRLVTCGGEFDRSVSSYEDNVVVYAVLAA